VPDPPLVLASDHAGLKDALIDGETGFSLPTGDAMVWTTTVPDVLAWSEDKRDAFVRNASASAKLHFAWPRVAKSTFAAYGWEV